MKKGNPQGKGLAPVLEAWHGTQPRGVGAKRPEHILSDYFVTLLVLSAEFAFKPNPNSTYHLYHRAGHWHLSLVGPGEWGERRPGDYLGACRLKPDMTWALEVTSEPADDLVDALDGVRRGFLELLVQHDSLEDSLPHYAGQLPYYRRLLAAGLASSLGQSLQLAGLSGRTGRQWLQAATGAALLPISDPG